MLALTMASLTFALGLIVDPLHRWMFSFINGFLVVIVANVPQGLPVTLTAQLLIVGRRLANHCGQMLLKRLEYVDTLGMTSILITDKSALLDTKHLHVSDVWV